MESRATLDAVLHFASPASPIDYLELPIQTLKVGSLGTHNALGLALAKGARFLLASTSEVYGDPLVHPQPETYWGNVNPIGPRGVYDEAKRFAEAITMAYQRAHGVPTRIVRIFNTYGERMRPRDGRVVPALIGQALAGEPLTVFGDGSQTRSFCYVSDLIDGIYRLLLSEETEPVNIGNPVELSVLEFARTDPRPHGNDERDRLPAAADGRPEGAPAGHHEGADAVSAGSRRSRSRRACRGPSTTSGLFSRRRKPRRRRPRPRRSPRPGSSPSPPGTAASSSGFAGCRKTNEYPRASSRWKLAGAVTRQTSQSMHWAST